jgi:MFS superfamily sulfate permease-like transporter
MLEIAPGWHVEMDRGPNWLLLRLQPPTDGRPGAGQLCGRLWDLMRRHLTTRMVVEFDNVPRLDEETIDQLRQLHERIEQANGKLRVCGLSSDDEQALRSVESQAERPISVFRSRSEAVLGYRPTQPR